MFKDKLKIIIYENKNIVIKNYQKLNDIDENQIVVDYYKIIGKFMHIKVLSEDLIEIDGQIKEIQIID